MSFQLSVDHRQFYSTIERVFGAKQHNIAQYKNHLIQ